MPQINTGDLVDKIQEKHNKILETNLKLMNLEQKKCIVSAMYGKDDNKQLHFYCDYCGKEMDYNEDRECKDENKPMSIEQIIARQEESFYETFAKDIGGGLLTLKKPLNRKEVLAWHSSSIKEILEGVVQIENIKTIPRQNVLICTHTSSMDSMCSKCVVELTEDKYREGYNQCITDTINHLENIIKQLK